MQGANFDSAREEMGRDQVARTRNPFRGLPLDTWVFDLILQTLTTFYSLPNYSRPASAV